MLRSCALLLPGVHLSLALCLAATPAAAQDRPLEFEQLQRSRLPAPAELAARAELAELRRELAGSSTYLSESPSWRGLAGARKTESAATRADLTLEGEWPLLAERGRRGELVAALLRHGQTLLAGAAELGRLELRRAYLAALLAQQRQALREEEGALLLRWQEHLRQRVEAGGAARFELELFTLETAAARLHAAEAAAEALVAWAELGGWTRLPPSPAPLAELPPLPPEKSAEPMPPADFLAGRVLAARYELAAARAGFDRSRSRSLFALVGAAGQEGEETLLHFGLSFRPFKADQDAATTDAAAASLTLLSRTNEIELGLLRGRYQAARQLLQATANQQADAFAANAARVVTAVELRLAEGKTTAAEALAIRRQVFALREQELEQRHRRALQEAEISFLTAKESP